jgi:hypothetical protein
VYLQEAVTDVVHLLCRAEDIEMSLQNIKYFRDYLKGVSSSVVTEVTSDSVGDDVVYMGE